jgi:methoxymalonate biosynthesis acyl carrier protein
MTLDGFQEGIRDFLTFDLDRRGHRVDDSTDLIQEGILDSLGIFALIGFLEQRYEVRIDAGEITLDNFRTIGRLERLVAAKLER